MATVPSDPDRVSVPGAVRPKRQIGAAALTLAVLLLGLAATSIAALGRRDQLDGEYESRYGLARLEAVGDLSAGVERYATVLRSAGAFITLSEDVTLDEFSRYGRTLDLRANYPGLEAVTYITPVEWADREAVASALAAQVPGVQPQIAGPPHQLALVTLQTGPAEGFARDIARDRIARHDLILRFLRRQVGADDVPRHAFIDRAMQHVRGLVDHA